MMNVLDNYNIDIYKLSNDTHNYQFKIGNSFFEAFPGEIVEKGSGLVDVTLNKSETLIELIFDIDVHVELVCDRSLEKFDYPLKFTKGLILKYGDEESELDDEIMIITRDKQRINVAQPIYEYISLAIPMKKLHPRFEGEDDTDEMIYSSKQETEDNNDEAVDPRWQALKKLK